MLKGKNEYNFIDVFSGAGGLTEGFLVNNFKPIAHVEMNNYAAETLKTRLCFRYLKKHKKKAIYDKYLKGDITRQELYDCVPDKLLQSVINKEISNTTYKSIFLEIDTIMNREHIKEIDVLIGGPPCQAYSLVGRAAAQDGMENDPRNNLYIQYARFLKKYQPKVFVFENVPGMITAKEGVIWKRIKQRLRTVGYQIDYKMVNAHDFGVLQKRKRILIVGWRKDLNLNYPEFEEIRTNAVVNDLLVDLPVLQPGEHKNMYKCSPSRYLTEMGIRNSGDILTDHQTRNIREVDRKIYRIAISMWNDNHKRLCYTDLPTNLKLQNNNTSFLDRFKVVEGDQEKAHTVLAHISKDGHYYIHPDIKQARSLSVREVARIQSFPDSYFFEGPRTAKFVQIGNAVPPLMAKGIAKSIMKLLKKEED